MYPDLKKGTLKGTHFQGHIKKAAQGTKAITKKNSKIIDN